DAAWMTPSATRAITSPRQRAMVVLSAVIFAYNSRDFAMKSPPDPGQTPPAPEKPAKASLATWAGLALSLVAVGVLLWRVDFQDMKSALAGAQVAWLAPSVAIFFVMFVLRAWRWSVLLGGTPFGVT